MSVTSPKVQTNGVASKFEENTKAEFKKLRKEFNTIGGDAESSVVPQRAQLKNLLDGKINYKSTFENDQKINKNGL